MSFAKIAGGIALVLAPACDSAAEPARRETVPSTIAPGQVAGREGSSWPAQPPDDDAGAVEARPGQDFVADARTLLRVAACGGDDMVPARFEAGAVDAHCKMLVREYDRYRARWLDVAEPFLQSIVPRGLPPVVVYPFGGGDLLTALATFPDATEFLTMSLEAPGDVRAVETLPPSSSARRSP